MLTLLIGAVASIAVDGDERTASCTTTAIRPWEFGVPAAVESDIPHQALMSLNIRGYR